MTQTKRTKKTKRSARLLMKQLELPMFRPRRLPRPYQPTRTGKVPHMTRPDMSGMIHVVMPIERGLPGMRTPRLLRCLEGCFRAGMKKPDFAVTHYSVQQNHFHVVAETKDRHTLARGIQALAIRLAKQLNAHWHRRGKGRVFAERYFATAVKTWKQAWRTIRYVLNNGRKHGTWTKKDRPDPFSSGPWFSRWRGRPSRPLRGAPVMPFTSSFYLPSIDVNDIPGPRWSEAIF